MLSVLGRCYEVSAMLMLCKSDLRKPPQYFALLSCSQAEAGGPILCRPPHVSEQTGYYSARIGKLSFLPTYSGRTYVCRYV